jgi:hypothetical protein
LRAITNRWIRCACGKLAAHAHLVEEPAVTNALEVLEAQALKLSAADRSRLLERLLASLDVDPDVEAAWDEVADARESALEGGQVTAVPLDEAIARLETRFPG